MSKRDKKTTTAAPSEALTRSRARQGLPPTITDPAIIAAVRTLIEHAEHDRR
jgi:hypothetical protein